MVGGGGYGDLGLTDLYITIYIYIDFLIYFFGEGGWGVLWFRVFGLVSPIWHYRVLKEGGSCGLGT